MKYRDKFEFIPLELAEPDESLHVYSSSEYEHPLPWPKTSIYHPLLDISPLYTAKISSVAEGLT